MNKNIKFVFFGTPNVAKETLEILKEGGFLPTLVVTQPDKPQGRGMRVSPPAVKVWAEKNDIPCLQPEKLDSNFTSQLSTFDFQLALVVAYGKIIPEEVLRLPQLGSINIHYSLLPKYRGASPVESAILAGEEKTGVTIQEMVMEMDAGDILAQEEVEIKEDEKTPELRARLIKLGGELLVRILPELLAGKIKPIPQDENFASVCKKIKKEDGLVNPEKDAPEIMYNKFRAYAEWPRTYFFQNGKRIIITDAELKNGAFVIKKVIPEGGKERNYQ